MREAISPIEGLAKGFASLRRKFPYPHWILARGRWRDEGFWVDAAPWRDAA